MSTRAKISLGATVLSAGGFLGLYRWAMSGIDNTNWNDLTGK